MSKIQIEEFPEIHPDVLRHAIAATAYAANSFAYQGANVCGVTLRVEGDTIVGSARVILPEELPPTAEG